MSAVPSNATTAPTGELSPEPHVAPGVDPAAPPVLQVQGLKKYFRVAGEKHVTAVDDISLTVAKGEFLVLLGPSGCGKTTLLRCVAGLDQPDSGQVSIGARTVYDSDRGVNLPPYKRDLSMVFQTYALWPHMKAAANVGYPLRARGMKKEEISSRVKRVLELVGVSGQANRYPNQMSGGQQQRVALARALVAESDLILFDEPLSNIDAKVREQLRIELLDMQRSIGFTALYVTHDQAEAMQLAHRIAVLGHGKVAQLDDARTIYDGPTSRYVAQFIGRANEVAGTVSSTGSDGVAVATPLGTAIARPTGPEVSAGDDVIVTWRPENGVVEPVSAEPPPHSALTVEGIVGARTYVGMNVELIVHVEEKLFLALAPPGSAIAEGDKVRLRVPMGELLVLPAGTPGEIGT